MIPFGSSFLSKESARIVPFIIPLVVLLFAYALPHSDLITLLFFALLTLIFSICRFDARILIGYAIMLFVIEAVLTARNEVASVKLLAILSYWLLVGGIICTLIDLCRNKWAVETVG
jgi:hypothetical protein